MAVEVVQELHKEPLANRRRQRVQRLLSPPAVPSPPTHIYAAPPPRWVLHLGGDDTVCPPRISRPRPERPRTVVFSGLLLAAAEVPGGKATGVTPAPPGGLLRSLYARRPPTAWRSGPSPSAARPLAAAPGSFCATARSST